MAHDLEDNYDLREGERRGGDRRKADLPYDGPDRRKHQRRDPTDRRVHNRAG